MSLEAFVATEFNQIFFGQKAASECEGFPAFREPTTSPSSGYAGGLVKPKLMIQ